VCLEPSVDLDNVFNRLPEAGSKMALQNERWAFSGIAKCNKGTWLKMLCLFKSFALAPQRRGVDAEYAGSLIEVYGRGHYGDDVFFFHLLQ